MREQIKQMITKQELELAIKRDIKVRSQIRHQKKRQLKLRDNHGRGKHRVLVLKCQHCQDVKELLKRIGK